jgi:diaminohydroxyphosphoribosylaminopyrimidine deaminase / 5-amino-6-(5-phosphoribosylamino)uracil reductase
VQRRRDKQAAKRLLRKLLKKQMRPPRVSRGETHGCEILGVPRVGGTLDVSAIRTALGDRGLSVVFVEGGGITISHFLEAGCLNRLQITVAPIIIGSGRPGVAFPGDRALDRALRPRIRRFDLGGDTLFDCDFDA